MPAPIVGVVKAGGAAETAGVKAGDRIVNFDGVENPTWERIRNDSLISPGQEMPLTVSTAAGQKIPLTIKPTQSRGKGKCYWRS